MLTQGSIDQNLRFLILEVSRQVERTQAFLDRPSERGRRAILDRDDYIDRLRTIIQRSCFETVRELEEADRLEMQALQAADAIASNLERIADFCESVVGQFAHLRHPELLTDAHVGDCLGSMCEALALVEPALEQRDIAEALRICRVEHRLDLLHEDTFRKVLAGLEAGGDAQSMVTVLFISHYFERMGDSVLNIGESILSACLGEKIKIDEFLALQDGVEESEVVQRLIGPNISLEALGETRSGCRIDRLSDGSGDRERMVVLKEGRADKILEEKESVDRWNERFPGLAPRIHSYQERDHIGAILYEYLPGRNFEELILRSDHEQLEEALDCMVATLERIWQQTRVDGPVGAGFIAQIQKRLPDVFALHPELRHARGQRIGGLEVEPFEALLDRTRAVESFLTAPFSVWTHGDLNVDNAIFDPIESSIRFVDLRRSRATDYVQDVSVFMVSHFRLQVFESPIRRRIDQVIRRIWAFASDFAERSGDPTFQARLGLGLARSFATSVRFVIDEEFARNLFLRSRYLLERLRALDEESAADFRLPEDVFVD